jgi:hypothetical protein
MSKGYHELIARYVQWNLNGSGQDRGRYSDWSYRESRFFNQHYPIARIVSLPSGEKVRLVRSGQGNSWHGGKLTVDGKQFHTYYVPDVGVFSLYEGDWLPEDKMHQRTGYIMLQQVRCYAETQLERLNGKKLQERGCADRTQRGLTLLYERFDKYSALFELGWDPLPGMYATELAEQMDRMLAAYNDPKAVIKRQRAAARTLAKKTLGLG